MSFAYHPLTVDELAKVRVEVALLNLPVRVELDEDCCVIHLEDRCTTWDEADALRLVGKRTNRFRRAKA